MSLLVMVLVCLCLGLAAFGAPALHPRVAWFPLGMFIWALKVLLLGISV